MLTLIWLIMLLIHLRVFLFSFMVQIGSRGQILTPLACFLANMAWTSLRCGGRGGLTPSRRLFAWWKLLILQRKWCLTLKSVVDPWCAKYRNDLRPLDQGLGVIFNAIVLWLPGQQLGLRGVPEIGQGPSVRSSFRWWDGPRHRNRNRRQAVWCPENKRRIELQHAL